MLVSALEECISAVAPEPKEVILEVEPHQYSALPSSSAIRLLHIHAGETAEIHCTLRTVDLTDRPQYDALSYTWGDPRAPLFQSIAPDMYRRKRTIYCNERRLDVSQNLYDAMQHLRSLRRRAPSDGPMLQKHIWIDALCINQKDLEERGAQVRIMDQIFGKASLVIAWLGKKSQYTDQAIRLVQRIAKTTPQPSNQMLSGLLNALSLGGVKDKIPSLQPQGPKYEDFTREDWEALLAMFKLAYFSRAWIVQELALASRIICYWGNTSIAWEDLVKCSTFMANDNILTKLKFMMTYFANIQDHINKATLIPSVRGVSNIDNCRKRTGLYSGANIPWYALATIQQGRGWSSTDPRDRVYALFGLTKAVIKDCPATEPVQLSADDIPKPDYTKSVVAVYTDFAIWQINISSTLFPLCMVEDRGQRSAQLRDSLPSWVPDFSVTTIPAPMFLISAYSSFLACTKAHDSAVPLPINDGTLIIRAGFFDSVQCVADPFDTMPLKEGFMSVIALIEPLMGWSYPILGTDYLDALWRTLIMDSDIAFGRGRKSPANPGIRQGFHEWLLMRMIFFEGSKLDKEGHDSIRYYKVQRMLLNEIIFEAAEDPTIFHGTGRTDEELAQRYAFEELQKGAFNLRGQTRSTWLESLKDYYQALTRLVQKDQRTAARDVQVIQATVQTMQQPKSAEAQQVQRRVTAFRALAEEIMTGRRLFTTRGGFVGIGSASIAPGDQVWIMDGLNAPGVLRASGSERYQWRGETYVHGIMGGEGVANANIVFHDIEVQ